MPPSAWRRPAWKRLPRGFVTVPSSLSPLPLSILTAPLFPMPVASCPVTGCESVGDRSELAHGSVERSNSAVTCLPGPFFGPYIVQTLFLESRWGVDSGSGTRLCSAFLFPRPSRFRVCAVFVLGPTEFRARRVRAGVELEAGWSGPSSSPVRGRLLFSGPFPCGWGNQGLGATLVRHRAKSVGARAASPGSRGLTWNRPVCTDSARSV